MPDRLYEFVRQENIRQFERKLEVETDPKKRRLLGELLAAEKAKEPLVAPPPGDETRH